MIEIDAPRDSATNGRNGTTTPLPNATVVRKTMSATTTLCPRTLDDRSAVGPLLLVDADLGQKHEDQQEGDGAQDAHDVERGRHAEAVGQRSTQERADAEGGEQGDHEGPHERALPAFGRDVADVRLGYGNDHAGRRAVQRPDEDELPGG